MKLVIPATVATQQDLAFIIRDVRAYSTWASRELIKQKVAGTSAVAQPNVSKESVDIIQAWSGGKAMTSATIDALLTALEEYKKSAPVITITLAAVPSGDVKTKLTTWCRKELDPTTLVSFRLNRNILGGMVVAYGSHIHDWSFRRKLIGAQTSFTEVLSRV